MYACLIMRRPQAILGARPRTLSDINYLDPNGPEILRNKHNYPFLEQIIDPNNYGRASLEIKKNKFNILVLKLNEIESTTYFDIQIYSLYPPPFFPLKKKKMPGEGLEPNITNYRITPMYEAFTAKLIWPMTNS